MIAFATLFLGLVVGPLEIELLASPEVASVELRLDEVGVWRSSSPPWTVTYDVGERLEPRELQAIAYSADGTELDRAVQWLNVPHPPAVVDLVLEASPDGRRSLVRLAWESVEGAEPVAVEVALDGVPLEIEDPTRIELPPHDPRRLHFLRADLAFPGNVEASAEMTFGGTYADRHETELTAVPVRLERPDRLPPAPELDGWLRSVDEADLEIVAVEEGLADIVIVRDLEAQRVIRRMDPERPGIASPSFRFAAPLRHDHRVRMLSSVPRTAPRTDYPMELFQPSGVLTAQEGGLYWLLSTVAPRQRPPSSQRLSDAVAVAGMVAASAGRRRAVVLILGERPQDRSQLPIEAVRGYLRALRVPLFVWTVAEDDGEGPWGAMRSIRSLSRLERAVKELREELAAQRILWVAGHHLPDGIVLGPRASEARLAQ